MTDAKKRNCNTSFHDISKKNDGIRFDRPASDKSDNVLFCV